MKAHLTSFAALSLSSLSMGCATADQGTPTASTETGNPIKDEPIGHIATTDVTINVGLKSASVSGTPAVAGFGSQITGLWLQISELELISCAGESTSTDGLATPSTYSTSQSLIVGTPEDEICAIGVRTQPLSQTDDASVPPEGIGRGAALTGVNMDGSKFTAIVPNRIFSLLTPLDGGLRLDELGELNLEIEDTALLEAIERDSSTVEPGDGMIDAVYDDSSSPEVVSALETQLKASFVLSTGVNTVDAQHTVLARSTTVWDQAGDLLCQSECALQNRAMCTEACDTSACMSNLMNVECGPLYSELLNCRLALSPTELMCGEASRPTTGNFCVQEELSFNECAGAL